MKKQNNKTVVKTEEKPESKKVEEKKEVHFCKVCKFYDWTTEREFHRDGIRKGLLEIRAVCRNPQARSYRHLVKAEYKKRQCAFWEEGRYKTPKKKETKEKKTEPDEEKMTSPAEYHGPDLTDVERAELKKNEKKHSKKQHLKNGEKIIVKDPHNDDVKTFEQQGHRLVLVKQ